MSRSLLIFGGAGVGANLRYWLGAWIADKMSALVPTEKVLPWGTFGINFTGSLLIGIAMGWLVAYPPGNPWRLLLVVGVLGGYTTFSSFSWEALQLLQDRNYSGAAAYILGSCLLSFLATFLGFVTVRSLSS